MAYKWSAKRFLKLCRQKNLTRHEVAEATGISYSLIYYFEKEESLPRVEDILKLADLLGVTMDYLVGRHDDATEDMIHSVLNSDHSEKIQASGTAYPRKQKRNIIIRHSPYASIETLGLSARANGVLMSSTKAHTIEEVVNMVKYDYLNDCRGLKSKHKEEILNTLSCKGYISPALKEKRLCELGNM